MVMLTFSALFGLIGSLLKPIPFVAVAVAGCILVAAMTAEASWLTVFATFYGSLALAEFSYVGILALRG